MKFLTLLALGLATGAANAHTIFQQIGINGVMQARHDFMRLPHYDGPIEDVTSSAVACNGGPNPLLKISNNVAAVKAGDQITLQWGHTLDSDFNSGMIIDASHNGPISVWMAKVSDALGPIPNSGWFKIYEDGLTNGQWAVAKLIANKGKLTVTIPSCLANGDYLFRGELIALHAAGNYPGAQLYMTCAQMRLTNGGSATPATVNLPGAYSGSDPGIKFNLYSGATSYTIPGPRPFTCGGNSGVQPQPQEPTVTTTTVKPTSTTTAQAQLPTTPTSGSVNKYGQCGGIGYSGPTTCVGSTCVELNPYYSQCQ